MMSNFIRKIDALVQSGQHDTAKMSCQNRLAVNVNDGEALYLLGTVHLIAQEFEAGLVPLGRLCHINPNHLNALINLGNCYLALKRLTEASDCFEKALFLDENNAMALNNLGAICADEGKDRKAASYYERAQKCIPDDVEITSNLMLSYSKAGRHKEAVVVAMKLLRQEKLGRAFFPLFNLLKRYCFWQESNALFERLLPFIREGKTIPNDFSYLNLPLLTLPEIGQKTRFEVLRHSGASIDKMRSQPVFQHEPNQAELPTRWRVAYLSPDFRDHAVDHFIRGLIQFHDRTQFEIFCYSNTEHADEVTGWYQEHADHFVDIRQMNDPVVAEKIHSDGIHFLVDLAGYTTGGRLPVLSYSPAPVQLMYLGYPYTSGLGGVDYFICDHFLDGPENEAYFSEKMLHLPESFVSFFPRATGSISSHLPMKTNGFVTFGALINPYKLNGEVIETWAQILKQVKNARLILNHPEYDIETIRTNITARFLAKGVDAASISFFWQKHASGNFVKYYNEIDIVLDSFPATGGTTTIDALQMGKPVITLVGQIYAERLSYAILKNVGIDLEALMAWSRQDYVDRAVALSHDPECLSHLHAELPKAIRASVLCDPERFTLKMETLYLTAWQLKYPGHSISKEAQPVKRSLVV